MKRWTYFRGGGVLGGDGNAGMDDSGFAAAGADGGFFVVEDVMIFIMGIDSRHR